LTAYRPNARRLKLVQETRPLKPQIRGTSKGLIFRTSRKLQSPRDDLEFDHDGSVFYLGNPVFYRIVRHQV
jgi:hypothetical protein